MHVAATTLFTDCASTQKTSLTHLYITGEGATAPSAPSSSIPTPPAPACLPAPRPPHHSSQRSGRLREINPPQHQACTADRTDATLARPETKRRGRVVSRRSFVSCPLGWWSLNERGMLTRALASLIAWRFRGACQTNQTQGTYRNRSLPRQQKKVQAPDSRTHTGPPTEKKFCSSSSSRNCGGRAAGRPTKIQLANGLTCDKACCVRPSTGSESRTLWRAFLGPRVCAAATRAVVAVAVAGNGSFAAVA